jgi:NADH dehydrogenase
LADVVGASINPLDAVVPLRHLLSGVSCRTEEVLNIDLARNDVEFLGENSQNCRLGYDHLVLACGNAANLNVVPGMADHAFPLKSIGDAVALRSHIMEQMERAETSADRERRLWHLSFVVVGGGYSGTEAAGEINDLVRDSARYFRHFRAEDVTVTLIHSRDHILPEIDGDLREFARKKMEQAGVRILLNARVASATVEGVALSGGGFVRGGTIVCTIGNSTAPIVERLAVPKEKGRLLTEPDLRLRGLTNVWAIGDCAQIVNAHDGAPSPPTGQFAERQGQSCAQNIARMLRSAPTRPFSFKPIGQLCSIGGQSGVAEFMGVRLSGLLAWFMWRGVYLFKLPSWARRFQVGFDWFWLLLFPRDLAHVRARQTDRVSRAHYQAGDLIISRNEVPSGFYVVENGEVEIVKVTEEGQLDDVITVLGPGSFFAEGALLGNEPLGFSVRARTAVEVMVMGRNVFAQVSKSLIPFRDALAQTLNRRSIDLWKLRPAVHALLKEVPVRELMDPIPKPLLQISSTMDDVARAFVEHPHDVFYVASDSRRLEGVITMTDWLRALSSGAMPETSVSEIMVKRPVAINAEDDAAVAATVLREHNLKSLPVVEHDDRRLAGCLRARRLIAHVFDQVVRLGLSPASAPETSQSVAGTGAGVIHGAPVAPGVDILPK